MAEWQGPRHRPRGSPAANAAPPLLPDAPEAPGAVTSPQQPGEVPDRSSIPGQAAGQVPAAAGALRPLTEYQTAQRMMGVFSAEPGQEREPARFEQATASFEEVRKANPAQWPPVRPVAGYSLDTTEPVAELAAGSDPDIAPAN
ncbi:MAG: hypothetical protein M3464_04495 [Chloroflexota bacterium]|nr:hypothetical protein [Chloroflexota bacterium]